MPDPEPEPRLVNRLGALALAVQDQVTAATERAGPAAGGAGSALPAALTSLRAFDAGSTLSRLRAMVGLTHSGTVRLADRLVALGHAERREGPDGRTVTLTLTPAGRAAADRIAAARAAAVAELVGPLPEPDRRDLLRLVDRLLASATTVRLAERAAGGEPAGGALCRRCDPQACDRAAGACPVASTAGAPIGDPGTELPAPALGG